mmetsp:Transcript_31380/g.72231  ORF Transcript_31380/g.72231 Transcript_31380/m.72231 type:complete len:120 (-) Transcript_31380:546-905(-)
MYQTRDGGCAVPITQICKSGNHIPIHETTNYTPKIMNLSRVDKKCPLLIPRYAAADTKDFLPDRRNRCIRGSCKSLYSALAAASSASPMILASLAAAPDTASEPHRITAPDSLYSNSAQ